MIKLTAPKLVKTKARLNKLSKFDPRYAMHKAGRVGVSSLSHATPRDTGVTANSWNYTLKTTRETASITWGNSARAGSIPVVILLRYGHATRNGGYVSGQDFITPALENAYSLLRRAIREGVK